MKVNWAEVERLIKKAQVGNYQFEPTEIRMLERALSADMSRYRSIRRKVQSVEYSKVNPLYEDQYADCDVCGERYWGSDASSYLREVVTDEETETVCIGCIDERSRDGQS